MIRRELTVGISAMRHLDDATSAPETEPSQMSASSGVSANRPNRRTAYGRALRLSCPNCGRGKILHSYLKPVAACGICGEPYGHIRSDDAAPWLTILLVGHILVPVMVAVESTDRWPQGFSVAFWPIAAAALMAFILPRAKSLIMAVIWFERAPGSEVSG
ncbi:MAG: DUF983 domain-containing protein [Parvularculaceae bacterium]